MKPKTITFSVDLNTLEVAIEADGYEGSACSLDVNAATEGFHVKKRTVKNTTTQRAKVATKKE